VEPVKGNPLETYDRAWQNLLFQCTGTHHSVRDGQPYINEYTNWYNRHKMEEGIYANLMHGMVVKPPFPHKAIV
jgi:hypothetical protein